MFGSLFDKKAFYFEFLKEKDSKAYEELVRSEKLIEPIANNWQDSVKGANTDRLLQVYRDEIYKYSEQASMLRITLKKYREEKIAVAECEKIYKNEDFLQSFIDIIAFFNGLPKRLEVFEVYDKFDGTEDIHRIIQLIEEFSKKSKKAPISQDIKITINDTLRILDDKKEVFGDYFNPKEIFPEETRSKMMELKQKSDKYHQNYIKLKKEYIRLLLISLDDIINVGKESVRKYRDQLMTVLTMIQSENSSEIEKKAREGINFINQKVISLRKLKKALESSLENDDKVARANLETIRKSMSELVPTVVKSDTFLSNKIAAATRELKKSPI